MNKDTLFFWRPSEPEGYLSNWYQSEFTDPNSGIKYCSTEQWLMFQKACLFKDYATAEKVLKTTSPKTAKSLGRQVKNFDEQIWKENCRQIMFDGCLLKFSQNPDLQQYLLSTKDKVIAEASPFDKIWGIGLDAKQAKAVPKKNWPGTNWLGECLMQVRQHLQSM